MAKPTEKRDLLRRLVLSRKPIAQRMRAYLDSLSGGKRGEIWDALSALDFEVDLPRFEKWLRVLLKNAKEPRIGGATHFTFHLSEGMVHRLDFNCCTSLDAPARFHYMPKFTNLDLLVPNAMARIIQINYHDDPSDEMARADRSVYLPYGLMLLLDGLRNFRALAGKFQQTKRVALVHFDVEAVIVGEISKQGFVVNRALPTRLDDLYDPF